VKPCVPAWLDFCIPDMGSRALPLPLLCMTVVSYVQELFCPSVYMHMQDDINEKMRSILIDWIAEVHLKFKLAPSTLYLTVHIIDRFCMLENVHRGKLQLVGVTALLIACKYEEVLPPEVRDCVYITDHAYNREEVLAMEKRILARLKFYVTVPTTWNFLSRILNVAKVTAVQYQRACYYSERALQEHGILAYRPSLIAATAVHLALVYDAGGDYSSDAAWVRAWVLAYSRSRLEPLCPNALPPFLCPRQPAHLAEYCNTSAEQMHACAHQMLAYLQAEPVTASRRHLVAVKKKFSHDRYLSVASERLPEPPSRDCNY
jgi:hypothetical protein